jgi:hypothetical protein
LTDSHEKEPESAPDDGKQPVVVGTGTRRASSPTSGALKLGLSILHQAIQVDGIHVVLAFWVSQ